MDRLRVDDADMNLFFVTDRAEEAVSEILKFYRRYHSMRYVWDQLVIRMNSPVPPELAPEPSASQVKVAAEALPTASTLATAAAISFAFRTFDVLFPRCELSP